MNEKFIRFLTACQAWQKNQTELYLVSIFEGNYLIWHWYDQQLYLIVKKTIVTTCIYILDQETKRKLFGNLFTKTQEWVKIIECNFGLKGVYCEPQLPKLQHDRTKAYEGRIKFLTTLLYFGIRLMK